MQFRKTSTIWGDQISNRAVVPVTRKRCRHSFSSLCKPQVRDSGNVRVLINRSDQIVLFWFKSSVLVYESGVFPVHAVHHVLSGNLFDCFQPLCGEWGTTGGNVPRRLYTAETQTRCSVWKHLQPQALKMEAICCHETLVHTMSQPRRPTSTHSPPWEPQISYCCVLIVLFYVGLKLGLSR
jgi:hypothetical protein